MGGVGGTLGVERDPPLPRGGGGLALEASGGRLGVSAAILGHLGAIVGPTWKQKRAQQIFRKGFLFHGASKSLKNQWFFNVFWFAQWGL